MGLPLLPEELWLEICSYIEARPLWLSLRPACKQLCACAEDIARAKIVPNFTIHLSFSLGSGSHHRWYDVRGSITLSFSSINRHNPAYALFDRISLSPESCHQRALEKWNQICSAGIGSDLEWRVQLAEGPVRVVQMPKLVISHEHGAWCDWREMLDAYFGRPRVLDWNRT